MEIQQLFVKRINYGQNLTQPLSDEAVPLVSVIVLTYKNQEGLYKTLESILEQEYPAIELFVSDDNSGIFDQEGVASFINQNHRENLLGYTLNQNKINQGTVAHANQIARLAKGEFIRFISCGDGFYEKHSLSMLVNFAQRHRGSMVVTSKSAVCSPDFKKEFYTFPDSRRTRVINSTKPQMLYQKIAISNIISSAGTLFRKELFQVHGGFDENYRLLEDLPLWLKLLRDGHKIPCLEAVTTFYAIGGVSSEDGTAFESAVLREDMQKCFELQINPYLDEFSRVQKYYLGYLNKRFLTNQMKSGWGKACFYMKYLPCELFRFTKTVFKICLKEIH